MAVSGLGFLVGYFVMYSIRSGTKTQDAFKSFLGVGGLAGGALLAHDPGPNLETAGLEASLLFGAGLYVLFAFIFGGLFSACTDKDQPKRNMFSVIIGRVLLGEDFRTPPPR